MVENSSNMFITGPDVVRTVTGEDVTQDELGGARVHAQRGGVASFTASDERACLTTSGTCCRSCPRTTPSSHPSSRRPTTPTGAASGWLDIVPAAERAPYDIRDVLADIVDEGDFLEGSTRRGRCNIVCGFARLAAHGRRGGRQPAVVLAGLARHRRLREGGAVRPHLRRVQHLTRDVRRRPRFPARHHQEYNGIIRHGAKLLYAYCESTVPRRAGGPAQGLRQDAYVVMDSSPSVPTSPTPGRSAQIAVMGAAARSTSSSGARSEMGGRLRATPDRGSSIEYEASASRNPYQAAERGLRRRRD